jgi:hypothetical protein
MGGVPLTRSLRAIADREMPHRADNSRTDRERRGFVRR